MASRRGTSNANCRGSSKDRKARKIWLLAEFGDGETALCSFDGCTVLLTFDTITVDRFPLSGIDGGRYVRGNIRPSCAFHNSQDGAHIAQQRKLLKI